MHVPCTPRCTPGTLRDLQAWALKGFATLALWVANKGTRGERLLAGDFFAGFPEVLVLRTPPKHGFVCLAAVSLRVLTTAMVLLPHPASIAPAGRITRPQHELILTCCERVSRPGPFVGEFGEWVAADLATLTVLKPRDATVRARYEVRTHPVSVLAERPHGER